MSRCLLIRAIIRRERLPEVLKALVDLGVQGATVYREVEGMGGEGGVVVIGGEVYDVLTPRVAVDIVVDEKEVEKVVNTILKTAVGDGRIFVLSVEQAYRTRTGEKLC
jgi:nitrogen regulatory protein P-II 1